jgi:hypothetical protein
MAGSTERDETPSGGRAIVCEIHVTAGHFPSELADRQLIIKGSSPYLTFCSCAFAHSCQNEGQQVDSGSAACRRDNNTTAT